MLHVAHAFSYAFFFFCSFWLDDSACVLAKLVTIVTLEGLQTHTQKHNFFFYSNPLKKFFLFPTHRSPHGVGPLTFPEGNFGLVEPVSLQLFWDTPPLASCLTIAIKGDGRERKKGMSCLVCELRAPTGHPPTVGCRVDNGCLQTHDKRRAG